MAIAQTILTAGKKKWSDYNFELGRDYYEELKLKRRLVINLLEMVEGNCLPKIAT